MTRHIEGRTRTVACGGRPHKQDPPPAVFRVDIHGCKQVYACADCVATDRKAFADAEGARCGHCHQFFATFAAAEQVHPL